MDHSGKAILCLDDEPLALSLRKMVLESEGYTILTAETGPEALSLFSSQTVDLAILDYLLPGMNGHDVAEKMRELKPDLPILMLSAYVNLPSETLALVDRSITKGEPTTVMLQAVAELLGAHS